MTESTRSPLRVLVLCDDWEAAERYEDWLSKNFDVEVCVFASESVSAAQRLSPQLVVLDLQLLDCTPIEFSINYMGLISAGIFVWVGLDLQSYETIGAHKTKSHRFLSRPFTWPSLIQLLTHESLELQKQARGDL